MVVHAGGLLLGEAGLVVDGRLVREPDEHERPRQGRQAFFLAHRLEAS
ncbi:hypothetical protein [Streptomyces collinus]